MDGQAGAYPATEVAGWNGEKSAFADSMLRLQRLASRDPRPSLNGRHRLAEMDTDDAQIETVVLFRPVGQAELDLIRESGYHAFPPRLPHQPIFYPVLTQEYAVQIARDWNTRDAASGYTGYVTRFRVRREFLDRYPARSVGSAQHQEYWVPAEELAEFNAQIVGLIEVVARFR